MDSTTRATWRVAARSNHRSSRSRIASSVPRHLIAYLNIDEVIGSCTKRAKPSDQDVKSRGAGGSHSQHTAAATLRKLTRGDPQGGQGARAGRGAGGARRIGEEAVGQDRRADRELKEIIGKKTPLASTAATSPKRPTHDEAAIEGKPWWCASR